MDEEINEHELGFSGQASGDSLTSGKPGCVCSTQSKIRDPSRA